MLIYFITLFIFWFKSFKKIKEGITKIISFLKSNETIKEEKEIKEEIVSKIPNKKKKKRKKKKKKTHSENNYINDDINIDNKIIDLKIKNKNERKHKKYSSQITQNIENKSHKSINKLNTMNDNQTKINGVDIKDIMEQKDFEFNSLDYEEAFKLDHRNYFEYYISLIKNNHPLMFSFAPYNDYNSKMIKIFLFFFSFSLDFTINALFFTDDTMHKIYVDKGKFNFLYQIPQVLYSTIISRFIDALIKNLALSQDKIVDLKKEEIKNLDKNYSKKLFKTLKIKFISFFIVSFMILGFFFYYIACFCGIYVNTQLHLIKDSLMSLITSFFYPFIMFLIPGLFRIASLRVEKPSRKFLYKFSSLLENYLG